MHSSTGGGVCVVADQSMSLEWGSASWEKEEGERRGNRVDRWMDGWVGRWMNGWMDESADR